MARTLELPPIAAVHVALSVRPAPRPSPARSAVGGPFGITTAPSVAGTDPPDEEPRSKRDDHGLTDGPRHRESDRSREETPQDVGYRRTDRRNAK